MIVKNNEKTFTEALFKMFFINVNIVGENIDDFEYSLFYC